MSYRWELETLKGVDVEWTSAWGTEYVSIPGLRGHGPKRRCARIDFVFDEFTGEIGDQYGHDFVIKPGPAFYGFGFGVDGPSLRMEFENGGHVYVQERLWRALVIRVREVVICPTPLVLLRGG